MLNELDYNTVFQKWKQIGELNEYRILLEEWIRLTVEKWKIEQQLTKVKGKLNQKVEILDTMARFVYDDELLFLIGFKEVK